MNPQVHTCITAPYKLGVVQSHNTVVFVPIYCELKYSIFIFNSCDYQHIPIKITLYFTKIFDCEKKFNQKMFFFR